MKNAGFASKNNLSSIQLSDYKIGLSGNGMSGNGLSGNGVSEISFDNNFEFNLSEFEKNS